MEKVRKIMFLLFVVLGLLTLLYFYQGSMLSQEIGVYADVEETADDATVDTRSSTSTVLVYNNINNGDPWFNASDAFGFTWLMADIWNASATSGAPSLTLIHNSKNNSWSVNESNLQEAVWDLNSTGGGIVNLPECNITITTEHLISSNIKYIGLGNNRSILYQEDMANCSLMQNEHWTNGYSFPSEYDENIWIEGITFDGNDYGQELWSKPADYSQILHGIKFMAVRNVTITNCYFKDITGDGVNVRHGSHVSIDNNWFDGIGMNYSDSDWSTEVTTRGAYFMYCDNSTFNFNHAKNLHCSAVAIEPGFGSATLNNMENFQVIGNIIDGGWNGIWVEGWNSSDGGCIRSFVISNNVLTNITRTNGYRITNIGNMNAIGVVRYTYDYVISNNVINKAGNVTHPTSGIGIWANGENGSVTGNVLDEIYGIGIRCEGDNIISDNTITNCSDYGIEMNIPSGNPYVFSPVITNNRIVATKGGIGTIYASDGQWAKDVLGGVISDNVILDCDTSTEWINGIYNRFWNMTITGNQVNGGYDGILNRGSYVDISHNRISLTGRAGIRFYNSGASMIKNIVNSNIILNVGDGNDDCIQLYDVYNSSISFNIGEGDSDGIDETGTCDYNIYIGNNMDCDDDDYDINSSNSKPATPADYNIGTFA